MTIRSSDHVLYSLYSLYYMNVHFFSFFVCVMQRASHIKCVNTWSTFSPVRALPKILQVCSGRWEWIIGFVVAAKRQQNQWSILIFTHETNIFLFYLASTNGISHFLAKFKASRVVTFRSSFKSTLFPTRIMGGGFPSRSWSISS